MYKKWWDSLACISSSEDNESDIGEVVPREKEELQISVVAAGEKKSKGEIEFEKLLKAGYKSRNDLQYVASPEELRQKEAEAKVAARTESDLTVKVIEASLPVSSEMERPTKRAKSDKPLSIRQKNKLQEQKGQAKFTLKSNRDCPDLFVPNS